MWQNFSHYIVWAVKKRDFTGGLCCLEKTQIDISSSQHWLSWQKQVLFHTVKWMTWTLGYPSESEKKDKDPKTSVYYIALTQLHTQREPWLPLSFHPLQVFLLPLLISLSFLSLSLFALCYEKPCSASKILGVLFCAGIQIKRRSWKAQCLYKCVRSQNAFVSRTEVGGEIAPLCIFNLGFTVFFFHVYVYQIRDRIRV